MSPVSINELPTEILQKTLRYLQLLDLIRCRRVCARWRDVVDSVAHEGYWRQLCRQDFPSIYKDARRKCHPSLPWRELYKSLHLWGKLVVVEEDWIPICSYSKREVGPVMVSAIEGRLCVHETNKMVYYDFKGEKTKEFNPECEIIKFRETESAIVYHIIKKHEIIIMKKLNGEPDLGSKVVIRDVIRLSIVAEDVYYIKYDWQVYVSKAKDNYKSIFVEHSDSEILAMGCKNDTLNVFKYPHHVFALEKDKFVFKENVKSKTSRYILNTYNFRDFYQLLFRMSDEVGFRVRAYYFYGRMTFLGGADGILRMYDTESFLDNPRIEPICQFYIEICLKPKPQYSYKIKDIDIIEKENGHIILVAISKGVFAIEITHNRLTSNMKRKLHCWSENLKKTKLYQ